MKSTHSLTPQTQLVKAAALYTRVSSQEQAQHGVSLSEQKERLEAWAKLEGWSVAGFYSDEGYTGANDNRPELQRLMTDAQGGVFNIVCVTKLDRLFRNSRLLLNFVHQLEELGITFVSQSEGIDTSKPGMGKIIMGIVGSVAEWERERISERARDTRQHLKRAGRWGSGRTPFGYRFNKASKELEIETFEADAIRFIFNTYTSQQLGTTRTAEICNEKSLITPREGRRKHTTWTTSTVRHVLTHPAYQGGPNSDWPFKTPAIITAELWELAQRQLANNRHFRATDKHNPYSGLLRCGLCGHTLRIGYSHSIRPVWECPGRLKVTHLDGSPRCKLPRFKAPELERNIIERVLSIFSDPFLLKEHIAKSVDALKKEGVSIERKIRPIRGYIDKVQDALKRADTMYELGRLDNEGYRVRVNSLRRQIQVYEQQVTNSDPLLLKQSADIDKSLAWYEGMSARVQHHFDMRKSVIERYGELDEKAKYMFMRTVLEDVLDVTDYQGNLLWADPAVYIPTYLRQLGFFVYVYRGHVELKGLVRQSNVTHSYMSDINVPFSITFELTRKGTI